MAGRLADKVAKVGLFLFLCLVGVGAGVAWLMRQPCAAPDRPRGVPPGSQWAGGCDGGNWFELLGAVEPGRYQLRIYHDTLGEVETEGWFEMSSRCTRKPPTREALLSEITSFDGENVYVLSEGKSKGCYLEKVK